MDVRAPRGIWRIGRAPDPLARRSPLPPEDLDRPQVGNRFDSALGIYSVLYFGSSLEACYGEVLARFRPDLELVAAIREDWEERGFMPPGAVPADWRQRRIAVRVDLETDMRFLDVESLEARELLRRELAPMLAFWGHEDLDVSVVRGKDRRVTRYISQWAYDRRDEDGEPVYGGVRYLSRLSSEWECWAVFPDVPIRERERITIGHGDEALQRVAKRYGLTIH